MIFFLQNVFIMLFFKRGIIPNFGHLWSIWLLLSPYKGGVTVGEWLSLLKQSTSMLGVVRDFMVSMTTMVLFHISMGLTSTKDYRLDLFLIWNRENVIWRYRTLTSDLNHGQHQPLWEMVHIKHQFARLWNIEKYIPGI